jgi:hypothetical protein
VLPGPHFPKYEINILLGDFNEKCGRGIIPKRQLGLSPYIRILKVMGLEQ